jgi:hypothetical protein
LKWSLIRAPALEALEDFLAKQLDYDLYSEPFADDLAEILQDNLPEDEADSAQTLASKCARNQHADDKINKVLDGIGLNIDKVLEDARARKAKDLVQEYAQREPDAVTLIQELLTGAGTSMDVLLADALVEKLDDIERIPPNDHRREPPQRQPARDRSASGGPRRKVATQRARDRGP